MSDDLDALAGNTQARILTVDIERLPGEVTLDVWEGRDFHRINYVHPSRWQVAPSLLCFAAKWYGSKRVLFHAAWDDYDAMVQASWDYYDEADVVVTYNGVKFDNKHLRSAWAKAGLGRPSPWRNVDLYQVNTRNFGFDSKSLAHLCGELGLPGKQGKYNAGEAKAAMAGDETARRRLRRYNAGDVKITEACFDALRPWVTGINLGVYTADEAWACPNCGGPELDPAGYATTALTRYPAYRCRACRTVARGNHRASAATLRPAR